MSGCPTPGDDACTDQTPCARCPSAVGLLTAHEVAVGVAGQESAWGVGQYNDGPAECWTHSTGPDHPSALPEGRLLVSILPDSSRHVTTPHRPTVGDA